MKQLDLFSFETEKPVRNKVKEKKFTFLFGMNKGLCFGKCIPLPFTKTFDDENEIKKILYSLNFNQTETENLLHRAYNAEGEIITVLDEEGIF